MGTKNGEISNKLRQCTLKVTVQVTNTGTDVQLVFAYTQFFVWKLNSNLRIAEQTEDVREAAYSRAILRVHFYCF